MKLRLLSIGFLLLAFPGLAHAQCPPTGRARDLLNKTPIGYYAKEVIRRTNDGIAQAKLSKPGASIPGLFDLNSLITIESIFYMLVDTDLRSVEYSRDLTSVSNCLHIDLAIIEAQIENVRCEINEAYDAHNSGAIRKLKVVANFLNQRYRHLVKGALDPQHVDESWSAYHSFDPPYRGWCCEMDNLTCTIRDAAECIGLGKDGDGGYPFYTTKDACITSSDCIFAENGTTPAEYEDMCPFDSDYLAYNDSGYGCSTNLTSQFTGGSFIIPGIGTSAMEAEADAQKNLEAERDSFLKDISHMKDVTSTMDLLVDNSLLTDEERQQLTHFGETASGSIARRHVWGCDADLPSNLRKNMDRVEGTLTPGIRPSEEWAGIPLRGPFFFSKDHLGVWNKLLKLYLEWEKDRQFSDYFKNPDEFANEADRKKAVKRDNNALGLLKSLRAPARSFWVDFQKKQAVQDAALVPKIQDTALVVRDAMKPVRAAMKKSIELVDTVESPLRSFAIDYAYFLRRTCIFRPCNERLDTIMKVLFTDECFPYASGEFTKALEPSQKYKDCLEKNTQAYCDANVAKYDGDPTWKKCQDAVDKL